MSPYVTRKEALAILQERTGRKFTMGVFSKHLRRDRVWAPDRSVIWHTDIDSFIKNRSERMARSPNEIAQGRVRKLLFAVSEHDTTLKNLVALMADKPETVKRLEAARNSLYWAFVGLVEAQQALRPAAPHALTDAEKPQGRSAGPALPTTDQIEV